jgi:hypothetical protein
MIDYVDILIAVFFGVVISRCAELAWHFWTTRPRRFTTAKDYFAPCRDCNIKNMSKIGWRERTEEEIRKIADRLTARSIRRDASERRRERMAARGENRLRLQRPPAGVRVSP